MLEMETQAFVESFIKQQFEEKLPVIRQSFSGLEYCHYLF